MCSIFVHALLIDADEADREYEDDDFEICESMKASLPVSGSSPGQETRVPVAESAEEADYDKVGWRSQKGWFLAILLSVNFHRNTVILLQG